MEELRLENKMKMSQETEYKRVVEPKNDIPDAGFQECPDERG